MRIVFCTQSNNSSPVEKFLSKLNPLTLARVLRTVELLEKYGNQLTMPHVKPMKQGLFELRIKGKTEIRILFCYHTNSIIFLHAFVKKSQSTPKKDLALAQKRKKLLTKI